LTSSAFSGVPSTSQEIKVEPTTYRDLYRAAYGNVEKQMKRENKLFRKLR
jgi:hypothetical protein